MRTLTRRVIHWLLDNPITISVMAFLLLLTILIYLDVRFLKGNAENTVANLLVEAHGLLFDLLLFGIIFAAFSIFTERRQKIERYKEEIDDYRRWDE
jgi:pilus assembly protein TadC